MIVISGALVAVAFVLLVIGLFQPDLDFVYASIAVSGAAFVFLIIGIFQRRGEVVADGEAPAVALAGSSQPGDSAVTTVPAPRDVPPAADVAADEASEGMVLVVADRPRYHVAGCRYLAGKDADEVDVREARAEGFTPCGVCKPDAALITTSAPLDTDEDGELVDEVDEVEVVEAAPAPPRRGTAAVKAPAKKAATATRTTAAKAAPVKAPAPAPAKAPAKAASPAPAKAPAKTSAKTSAKTPAKAPAKVAAAKAAPTKAAKAAAPARKAGTVVVIPDRGKFHTAQCRFVRGVDGTEELTKAQATRQGYDACGVCKP